MASLARIPFTASDEQVINTLTGWMLFIAVVQFLGGAIGLMCGCLGSMGTAALMVASPAAGVLGTIQMMLWLVVSVLAIVQGVTLVQGRSSLQSVVTTDTSDQQFLSDAFKRLKFFFLFEAGVFTVNIFIAILALISAFVAPELAGGLGNFGNLQGGGSGGGFGGGGGQW